MVLSRNNKQQQTIVSSSRFTVY